MVLAPVHEGAVPVPVLGQADRSPGLERGQRLEAVFGGEARGGQRFDQVTWSQVVVVVHVTEGVVGHVA